jgi:acetolactate synthase I/II/III large subunit
MIKVSDYVANFIQRQGVSDVFLLPGGGCIHLIDSIGKSQLNFVCNLHEQACSIAADAYGQYTNNIGVCLVTTGPGGTNAVTGVAAAWLDSTPMLALSGQVQKKDMTNDLGTRQIGFQEIDMVSVVDSLTKYAATVVEPNTIKYHLEKAVYLATHGRPGPVWLDIPLDVQAALVDESGMEGYVPEDTGTDPTQLEKIVSDIIEDLNSSERPVILAGNGIRLAGAIEEFKELIQSLGIPLLLTWKAIDYVEEEHPLFVGRPGGVGQRGANFSQQNSDFLFSIGARLDHGQTAYQHKYFARAATKVIVDIDPSEINKLKMDIKHPVPHCASLFIKEFIKQKHKIKINPSEWLGTCKKWQLQYPVVLPEYWEEKGYVNNYAFIDALSAVTPPGALLVPGSSGGCSEVTMQAFRIKKGQRMFNSEGLGPMGFGIAASIGGCIASGRQETICIDGDGGFVMNIQELETVRRLNLPIKFFVLNNNGYVSIRITQNKHFEGNLVASGEDSGLTLPPIKRQADAYGIPYAIIRNSKNLHAQLEALLAVDGPLICEIMLPPTHVTAPKASVYKKEDGSFAARPMEDLAPFLDRAEFKENMIIEIVDD